MLLRAPGKNCSARQVMKSWTRMDMDVSVGFNDRRGPDRLLSLPVRMLNSPFSPRLLKKVQMQGGGRCEVRGVLGPYAAAPRERGGTRPQDGSRQMGLFSSLLSEERRISWQVLGE